MHMPTLRYLCTTDFTYFCEQEFSNLTNAHVKNLILLDSKTINPNV